MFTDLKFFYRKSFTTNMLCKHSTTYLSKVYIYNTYDICTFHLQFWNFWVLCSGLQGKILKYSRLNKKKGFLKYNLQLVLSATKEHKNIKWAIFFCIRLGLVLLGQKIKVVSGHSSSRPIHNCKVMTFSGSYSFSHFRFIYQTYVWVCGPCFLHST